MKNKELYSEHWNERIRPEILRRDGYKCRVCGALNHKRGYYEPNGSFVQCDEFMVRWAHEYSKKIVVVHLQIAHLDQDVSNNHPENLRTFCPKHHFEFDHEFNRLKRLAAKK